MPYCYKAKSKNVITQNNYMLAKTVSMFEWENLPETIPYKELEKLLQVNGFAFITKVNGELYALSGGLGGELDVYYNPTEIVINNPALKLSKTFNIKNDGVLIINDDFKLGLIPLFERYNTFLVENDINMMMYGYNTRTQKLISASNDKTKSSAELAVRKAIDGEIAVIGESAVFEGMKVHAGANNSGVNITSLTEFHQYIKASLYNEVGLSANFNMKRERLTEGETELGEDSNYPFVYNMLKCRLKAMEMLNEKYDLNINVDFGSVWAKSSKEVIDDHIETGVENELETMEESSEKSDIDSSRDNQEKEELDPHAKDVKDILDTLEDENTSESDYATFKELKSEKINELKTLINDDYIDPIDFNYYKSLLEELENSDV